MFNILQHIWRFFFLKNIRFLSRIQQPAMDISTNVLSTLFSAAVFSTLHCLTDTADNYCSFAESTWLQPIAAALVEKEYLQLSVNADCIRRIFQHLSGNTISSISWTEDLAPKEACYVILSISLGITQVNIHIRSCIHTFLVWTTNASIPKVILVL